MFKKIAISTLLLVYLCVTTGFSVATHFCNDKLAEVTFNNAEKPGCGDMDMPMDCCRDNHVKVKVSDNHGALSNSVKFQTQVFRLFNAPDYELALPRPSTTQSNLVAYHSPPLHQGIPLTIVHSVFRI